MNFRQIDKGELIAIVGGIILGISLILTWYKLGNHLTELNGCQAPKGGGEATPCTGWHSLKFMRYLLLVAAVAPLILAYVVIRGHALSWPRGEMTAVIAMTALTLTVFRGVIDRPGSPPGEISVGIGFFVALVGGLLILAGSLVRTAESQGRRKPPGVL